jgi:CheY-like chemotaxis protein
MKKRILVVDDSATIRKVVTGILERHGYEAVAVPDAQLALEAIARDHLERDQLDREGAAYDLVLVDFVMPRMNGFQFCRELRKTELGRRLPVVLMSAKSDKIREKFVLQTGAVDAITKPFDAQALVTLLEHALHRVARGNVPAPIEAAGSEPPSGPPASDLPEIGAVSLSGDITGIPVGAIMQLLQMEAISGVLVVNCGGREVRVVMRKGLIDRVQSRGAGDEFRLGRFLVEAGLVTPSEIESLLEPSSQDSSALARRARVGEMLVQTGKLTEMQLRDALAKQSSELVYDMLRWTQGRFELVTEVTDSERQEPRLGLPVASVVMEGFRRVDEWRLIESKLGGFDEVLVPDPVALAALGDMGTEGMTKQERTVLAAIDSERTLREVVAASHLSSFDACKIVCQLLEARLVRRRAAN